MKNFRSPGKENQDFNIMFYHNKLTCGRGILKKRSREEEDEEFTLKEYYARRKNKVEKDSQFKKMREQSMSIMSRFKSKLILGNTQIKFSSVYFEVSKCKFSEFEIKEFASKTQKKMLKQYFKKHNQFDDFARNNYIASFSIIDIENSAEEMFNILSVFKLERKYAILKNRMKDDEILLMVSSDKFCLDFFLPQYEFSIISIKPQILNSFLQIAKSEDLVISSVRTEEYVFESYIESNGSLESHIISIDNIFYDFYNKNSQTIMIKDLERENTYLRKDISDLKEVSREIQIERIHRENVERELNHLQFENSNLRKTVDASISDEKIQNLNKELKDAKIKVEYLEKKKRCTVDVIDGYVIESYHDDSEEIKIKKPKIPNELLCIICMDKMRDCAFSDCSHIVYCESCCHSVWNAYNRDRRGKPSKFKVIECPMCKIKNRKFTKLIYC